MSSFIQKLSQSSLVQLSDLISLMQRPLPLAPDGQYDAEANGQNPPLSQLHNLLNSWKQYDVLADDIRQNDKEILKGLNNFLANPEAYDDRDRFFNETLGGIAVMQPGDVQTEANNVVVQALYNTLVHPPATYLKKQYRRADGGDNCLTDPDIGRAHTNYARSVQGKQPQPWNMFPDAGLVFDALLKAPPNDFKSHPNGNSSLTFAFASLVTHSLFRTNLCNSNQNDTSSYLDLSPLYGCDLVMQDSVRDKTKGLGLLYPDTFSEERLSLLPPAASVLLVLFSRNHNYIANMLLKINERKQWSDPPPTDVKKRDRQDEELFQTARLVNCGHFMSMIISDYLGGFLGVAKNANPWTLQTFDIIKSSPTSAGCPRGQGNHVSVEFNLLYRWHAVLSEDDIKWTDKEFRRVFDNKPFNEIKLSDFVPAYQKVFKEMAGDPPKRVFGNLKRQENGTFRDEDLASVLLNATEAAAGAYRARGIPESLRIIEILSIDQARKWGVCTFNEFREFLGLKRLTTFEQWNSDKSVAEAARKLYNHIDNMELYPGLIAEEIIPPGPGSGLCAGYTMTRAILSDAISLVRGDRYYTTDFTPGNLTTWGYQDCARDPLNGAFGAALPKLLFRHLPNYYPENSVYALFPFYTPSVAKGFLTEKGYVDQYTFSRPAPQPVPIVLKTLDAIRYVFKDNRKFKVTYGDDMRRLTNGYGFFLVFDDQEQHKRDRELVLHALFPNKEQSLPNYKRWYRKKVVELIRAKSFTYQGVKGYYVDIVQDVINLASVHWATDILCGISLKTESNPKGAFTEQEMSTMLTVLFTCVFEDIDPEFGFKLRSGAFQISQIINNLIQQSITEVSPWSANNIVKGVFTRMSQIIWPTVEKECYPFLCKLAASDRPMKDLVANVIGLAVGSSVNFSQATTQVLDFYLDPKRKKELDAVTSLCKKDDEESSKLLKGYVREAMRLNPQYSGLFRKVVANDTIPQGRGEPDIKVRKGDLIFASFKDAHINPTDFANPEEVDPRRPLSSYQLQGSGFHLCPGVDFAAEIIPEILKIILTLSNLRRAPGERGQLKSFNLDQFQTKNRWYVDHTGNTSPWPGSLMMVFDRLPEAKI